MRRLPLAILSCCAVPVLAAPPAPPPPLPAATALSVRNLVAAEVGRLPAAERQAHLAATRPETLGTQGIEAAFREFDSAQRETEFSRNISQANRKLLGGALDLGKPIAAGGGPWSAVLYAAAAEGMKAQLEFAEGYMVEQAQTSTRRLLKGRLEEWRREHAHANFEPLRGKTPDQAFAELFGADHPLLTVDLTTVDPLGKDIATQLVLKSLGGTLAEIQAGTFIAQAETAESLDQARTEISGLAQALSRLDRSTRRQFEQLADQQQAIADDLDALQSRVGKTERDVQFIQQFMFGQMNPAEQLRALREEQFFPDLSAEERGNLERKIELVHGRQALIASFGNGLNTVATAVKIASDLGLDQRVVADLQKGVAIGAAAFNAVASFASGNYLGAVSAITGLMGANGPDAGAQRHEQVVGMLSQILETQGLILKEIDKLHAENQKIMENQRLMFNAVVEVSNQIADNQEQLLREFARIDDKLQTVLDLGVVELRQPAEFCRSAAASRGDAYTGGTLSDSLGITTGGHFVGLEQLADYYATNQPFIEPCLTGLLTYSLPAGSGYSPIYRLRTYEAVGRNSTLAFRTELFKELIEITWDATRAADLARMADEDLARLMMPVAALPQLAEKIAEPHPGKATLSLASAADRRERLAEYYSAPALQDLATLLGEFHYFYQLIDPSTHQLRSVAELASASPSTTGKRLLENALEVTNVAVAQRALLAGDVALPRLLAIWTGPRDGANGALRSRLQAVLERDPPLRRNLLLYALSARLAEAHVDAFGYSLALTSPFRARLDALLDTTNWPLVFDCEGEPTHCVEIGSVKEPLPTAEHLLNGRLEQWPDLEQLLRVRAQLGAELLGYEVTTKFTGSTVAAIRWLSEAHAPAPPAPPSR